MSGGLVAIGLARLPEWLAVGAAAAAPVGNATLGVRSWRVEMGLYEVLPHGVIALLAFAIGASLGSFINVLVIRLPSGMSVISPPSRCPTCGARLRWRDNLPVVGWLLLRGRCRSCGVSISPQYLLMEVVCGAMLVWIYLAHFATSPYAAWWSELAGPWWTRNGPLWALPAAAIQALLFVSLLAMTKIDARAFIIPMSIPTTLTGGALLLWGVQGLIPAARGLEEAWPIARLGWEGTAAALGGAVGIVLSILLLRVGLLRRSFADYDDFLRGAGDDERSDELGVASFAAAIERGAAPSADDAATPLSDAERPREIPLELQFLAPLLASVAVGLTLNGWRVLGALSAMAALTALLLPVSFLRGAGAVAEEAPLADYPHARREVLREVLFLAPCLLGLAAGWVVGARWVDAPQPAGLLGALAPALAGFLTGGGIVWGIRILATLIGGREATGLGDVHLLAAVGAAAGPAAAVAAFFAAPFLGLAWVGAAVLLNRGRGGGGTLQQGGMPFGPHLALGAVTAVALSPAVAPLLRTAAESLSILARAPGA